MVAPLEFEQNIAELESKLNSLRHLSDNNDMDIAKEVEKIEGKLQKQFESKYRNLTAWEKVLVARHQERPHFKDYLKHLFTNFEELAGDRVYGEDRALCGGLAKFNGIPVVVMGHEKGDDIESRLAHNFGMPRPEGYRKAKRLMDMASQFSLPLISFVDTAGAHPGKEAEERGQAEAIARSIEGMMNATVPTIAVVTGEGGSGGAIAIAIGNEVLMLEHSIYSVVSPEGCASILWRTADKKQDAAAAQKFTAQDLKGLGIIDHIIDEPLGGAHRNHDQMMASVRDHLQQSLSRLQPLNGESLKAHRMEKFLAMGKVGLS